MGSYIDIAISISHGFSNPIHAQVLSCLVRRGPGRWYRSTELLPIAILFFGKVKCLFAGLISASVLYLT
jgi:hypothetical protein